MMTDIDDLHLPTFIVDNQRALVRAPDLVRPFVRSFVLAPSTLFLILFLCLIPVSVVDCVAVASHVVSHRLVPAVHDRTVFEQEKSNNTKADNDH